MHRLISILISLLLSPVSMIAGNDLPVIEVRADRTMIYPQRMELTGEESLMDVLQMVPELMIGGYENVLASYNLRIDNCPMNGDTRLILSQMKAKDVAKIQVCDNTGVAKGTIGMGRARYFHTFNDQGTELLIVGGYQYASDPALSNKLPLYIAELNTPLFSERLSMMLGVEGDFLMTKQKGTDRSWDVFNNDVYLQFTYSLPKWKLTVGNRVMFYDYKLMNREASQKHSNTRDNANACVIYVPDGRNQIQLGYYRKYYNPSYLVLFTNANTLIDEEWARAKGLLVEWDINQVKLAYAYSKQKLTVQTEASYYDDEEGKIFTELGKRWNLGVDWHDMFDAFCSQAKVNRHAANIKL